MKSMRRQPIFLFFFFNDTATTEIYTLSLHDALPIWVVAHMLPALEGQRQLAHLGHAGAELGAELFLEPLPGHGTSGHRGGRQPCRGTAAAARITDAVFLEVGVVGMAGTKAQIGRASCRERV